MSVGSIPELEELTKHESDQNDAYLGIKIVLDNLKMMGVDDFCTYDPSIVRGLAYYTGIVFEVHDITGDLRAICGGGRFDNLLHDFGGPKISATGMGMGDCVLEILLRERGKLDVKNKTLDCFIVYIGHLSGYVWSIIEKLRSKEYLVKFDYKPSGLSKQLKDASSQNVKYCIIIGNDEVQKNEITVKNMSTSKQNTIPIKDFLENPEDFIVR